MRSHPKNPRFSNSVSSRSVFARRCSRDTATLEAWNVSLDATRLKPARQPEAVAAGFEGERNAVVELSQSSWLVGGVLPGIERQPCKKLEPSD